MLKCKQIISICLFLGGVVVNKICTFAGHGNNYYYSDDTYKKIISCLKQLITDKNISEFWVGNYGYFDAIAARAVRNIKEEYPHIKLCLVVPYITSRINKFKLEYVNAYDEIIIPEMSPQTPIRAYIPICNQYMVDKSVCLLCYIERESGGAFKTYKYALKKGIEIINISN